MSFDYEPVPYRETLERYGLPEDVIDGVLHQHAHELAERIRKEGETEYANYLSQDLKDMQAGIFLAADLIDPGGAG